MSTIVLTLDGARPNDLPPMIVDEKRNITFKCSPVMGDSTISSFSIEADPSNVTLGAPSTSGGNATVLVTATQTGRFTLVPKATLSNGEIVKALVGLEVTDTCGNGDDYQG